MSDQYKIVRVYRDNAHYRRTILTGLTLEEAQAHCNNPETSSSTCTNAAGVRRTREKGPWFDSYTRDETEAERKRRIRREEALRKKLALERAMRGDTESAEAPQ